MRAALLIIALTVLGAVLARIVKAAAADEACCRFCGTALRPDEPGQCDACYREHLS